MSCCLEFPESSVKVDFCAQGYKQKILIEVLIRHGEIDISRLASTLGVSVEKLDDICSGKNFLFGRQVDDLAQLFLTFLGEHFLRNCTIIRNFIY